MLLGAGEHFSAGHDLGTRDDAMFLGSHFQWFRMTKLATNQVQDAQGYPAHMTAAHAMYVLGRLGERDPDSAVVEPGGRPRSMVQRAMDNFEAGREHR